MRRTSESPDRQDRRARDARIRALDAQGVSRTRIAEQLGISRPRVTQILSSPTSDVDAELIERERLLQDELAELVRHQETNRIRIRALQRTLQRIAEEREARAIDELLGLG